MSMALIAMNKVGFIDGTLLCLLRTDPLYNSWSKCNSMVMSWILHVVSKEIAYSIMYIYNVYVWIDLDNRFHQSNGPQVFKLK